MSEMSSPSTGPPEYASERLIDERVGKLSLVTPPKGTVGVWLSSKKRVHVPVPVPLALPAFKKAKSVIMLLE